MTKSEFLRAFWCGFVYGSVQVLYISSALFVLGYLVVQIVREFL